MSKLDPKEVSRARFGPRELKDPRSKEYAIQTLYALKTYAESLKCDQDRVARELAEIERYQHWKILGYKTKKEMLEAELNPVGIKNVNAIGKHGGDRKSEGFKNQACDASLKYGTVKYFKARLARDHPDILAALDRGEYTSARQAAIAAGIVKVKTVLEQLCRLWEKATESERREFRERFFP